jgi:hypothetical protein
MTTTITSDREAITVHLPLAFRRRGGRKQIIVPDGAPAWMPARTRVDNAMVKAIARAFRWRNMLESGQYATIREIATAENINESYVSRVLRLTLLAPATVEAILDGRQGPEVTLAALMRPFPGEWAAQRSLLGEG